MTSHDFRMRAGPLSVWQELNGRMYLGDPSRGGVPLFVGRPHADPNPFPEIHLFRRSNHG